MARESGSLFVRDQQYLAGLVVCDDCNKRMTAWSQMASYRCVTNQHDKRICRCNMTKHAVLEQIVLRYLEETNQALNFLYQDPEHCREVLLLEEASQSLILEYSKRIGKMWREAKDGNPDDLKGWTHARLVALKAGKGKADKDAIKTQLAAKEKEKERLAKRIGLVDDEDAAQAIAERIKEVAAEIRRLHGLSQPLQDRLDALRDELRVVLSQVARVRDEMVIALPLRKKEFIRSVVKEIRVKHKERQRGMLRGSELIGVEIVPVLGAIREFHAPDLSQGDWVCRTG